VVYGAGALGPASALQRERRGWPARTSPAFVSASWRPAGQRTRGARGAATQGSGVYRIVRLGNAPLSAAGRRGTRCSANCCRCPFPKPATWATAALRNVPSGRFMQVGHRRRCCALHLAVTHG
jgi:hypothetical protein